MRPTLAILLTEQASQCCIAQRGTVLVTQPTSRIVSEQCRLGAETFNMTVQLENGGSCTFHGDAPYRATFAIPAMSGDFACTDGAGGPTDAGFFSITAVR